MPEPSIAEQSNDSAQVIKDLQDSLDAKSIALKAAKSALSTMCDEVERLKSECKELDEKNNQADVIIKDLQGFAEKLESILGKDGKPNSATIVKNLDMLQLPEAMFVLGQVNKHFYARLLRKAEDATETYNYYTKLLDTFERDTTSRPAYDKSGK